MIKYKFNTKEDFNNTIKEAKDKNVKITYKNIKLFTFPCEIPVNQIWNNREVVELIIYNKEDFVKESYNELDLLYSIIDYVAEYNGTYVSDFNFGKAYVKGIQYKEDKNGNLLDKIDFLRVDFIENKNNNGYFGGVGIGEGKIYLNEIYKVYSKNGSENE